MKPGKAWVKRIIIAAGIIAIIGVGMNFAAELIETLDPNDEDQIAEQRVYVKSGSDRGEADGAYQSGRDDDDEGDEHEEWIAGMAFGAAIIGAGAWYAVIRRKKRSSGMLAVSAIPALPSSSDFLDQWEQKQTNTKETK